MTTAVDRLVSVLERQQRFNQTVAAFMQATDELDTLRGDAITQAREDIVSLREGLAALSNRIEALTQLVSSRRPLHDPRVIDAMNEGIAEAFRHDHDEPDDYSVTYGP
jgi:hypothetical protein